MRIIAGEFRGRTVKMPKSKLVRPTTDRNKEAIFNYLQNRIDFDGILGCDIYAGSGSLGLEMLSRGASAVHFVEKNFHVSKVLSENIGSLGVNSSVKLFKMAAVKFSKLNEHSGYDLIIADPPFFQDDIHEAAENLRKNGFLNSRGILLVERSIQTEEKDIEAFRKEPVKRMGDSLIYVFEAD